MSSLSRQLLWLFLMTIGIGTAQAQYTETRDFEKRFAINSKTGIEITNKYGKVELFTWEKDSVLIKVNLKVEAKNSSRLKKVLDNIDFDFSSNSHYLIIRTIADKNRSQLESEFLKFKETLLLQTSGSIEINYKIWLPASNPLTLENKFGDIFMEDYTGPIEISLSNGKLKAHKLGTKTTIKLNFADASINQIMSGDLTTNYSDLYIKEVDFLRISGKSSDIEILEATELKIDSRRDKFRIKSIEKIEIKSSFSTFRLYKLINRGMIRMNYGELEIENIKSDFVDIYIESRATDIELNFNAESYFNFELSETKVDLDLGRELFIENKEKVQSKNALNSLQGYFKEKSDEDSRLVINAISGNIRIDSYLQP